MLGGGAEGESIGVDSEGYEVSIRQLSECFFSIAGGLCFTSASALSILALQHKSMLLILVVL